LICFHSFIHYIYIQQVGRQVGRQAGRQAGSTAGDTAGRQVAGAGR